METNAQSKGRLTADKKPEAPPRGPGVAHVVVDAQVPHLDHPFEYLIAKDQEVFVGSQVEVRFGGRKTKGWVTRVTGASESGKKLAPLTRVIGPFPLVSPELLKTATYLARRYATSLTQVLSFVVPTRRASEEKRVASKLSARRAPADVASPLPEGEKSEEPTGRRGARRAVSTLFPGQMLTYLFAAASEQAREGRQVVVVVPTSSAAQILGRFISEQDPALKVGIATALSSPQVRYRVYLEAVGGLLDIVVGTRSAVWTSMPNLGAVIVWDDGDDRLRERRAPRFDVLDVAVARSQIEGIDLLACSYSRSVKSQMLVHSGWANDVSPPREPNLVLVPKVRVFDWFSAQQEGPEGATRFPSAAYSLLREGLKSGPVLVQVAAAGYETPIPCPLCGGPAEEPKDGCAHPTHEYETRLRIGSDRVREDLDRAFPNVDVLVSSSTGGMLRIVDPRPQIVVATAGSEPLVEGGYAAVVITEAEGLAYLDELWAPLEAARRWFNALALSAPSAPAMLIGSFDEVTQRSVVLWRPQDLAESVLSERIALGFPPARWVTSISGTEDGVSQVREAVQEQVRELAGQEVSEGLALPEVAVIVDQVADEEVVSKGDSPRELLVVSCTPKHVKDLMGRLWAVQVERSSKRQSLLEFEVNPPRIAPR